MPKILKKMVSSKHNVAFFEVQGRSDWYVVEYDGNEGRWWCSCPGFAFRKDCSHIRFVKSEVGEMPISVEDILEGKSNIRYFDSPFNSLNEMFDGYPFSSAVIFGVVAAYKAGKTLMSIELAHYLASKGYTVLYIDTEGSSMTMFKQWAPIFKAKYNLESADNILIEDRRSLYSLMKYLGYDMKIINKVSNKKNEDEGPVVKKGAKSAKIEISLDRVDNDGDIARDIEKYGVDFIILDSMSNPFRSVFSSEQQNYPAKSRAEAVIVQKLIELQKDYNVGVLVTLQASWNPADVYASITQTKARGGFSVYYNIKRMIFMNTRDMNGLRNYRKIWLVRAEDKPEWSEVAVVKITDAGYVDVPHEEWKQVFTQSELKLVNF